MAKEDEHKAVKYLTYLTKELLKLDYSRWRYRNTDDTGGKCDPWEFSTHIGNFRIRVNHFEERYGGRISCRDPSDGHIWYIQSHSPAEYYLNFETRRDTPGLRRNKQFSDYYAKPLYVHLYDLYHEKNNLLKKINIFKGHKKTGNVLSSQKKESLEKKLIQLLSY